MCAALEILQTVQDAGLQLPCRLEAIDFTDEEGTLVGLLGSRALAGHLPETEFSAPRGGLPALLSGFKQAGLDPDRISTAARNPASLLDRARGLAIPVRARCVQDQDRWPAHARRPPSTARPAPGGRHRMRRRRCP